MFQLKELPDTTLLIVYHMPGGGSIAHTFEVGENFIVRDSIGPFLNIDHVRKATRITVTYGDLIWKSSDV